MQNANENKLTPAQRILQLQEALAGVKEERWKKLCEQAAVEKDPEKLLLLMREFDLMLEERQRLSKGKKPASLRQDAPQPER